jgi:hypothetical protein
MPKVHWKIAGLAITACGIRYGRALLNGHLECDKGVTCKSCRALEHACDSYFEDLAGKQRGPLKRRTAAPAFPPLPAKPVCNTWAGGNRA